MSQMVMAVPVVVLGSTLAHAVFWLVCYLSGMRDPWIGWWQGDGLFGLAIGVVFGLIAYLLLLTNAEKVIDRTLSARVLHAAFIGCSVGAVPVVIVTALKLLSTADGLEPQGGAIDEARMIGLLLSFVLYPIASSVLWAVLSWQPSGVGSARGIGDG